MSNQYGNFYLLCYNINYKKAYPGYSKSDFRTYTSLDALFEQLDDAFLRAQRSYVVNMRFVESFLFDRVILAGGTEIMLSRSNRTELKRQYQSFLFRLARRAEE